MGADIVLGSAQRFGVPMGFGGPHAAFFATRDAYKRSAPGRIIGVSRDRRGKIAVRMAMQTREQHIRRDKATSNICTAQALLANMASFYAVYHGPEGIKTIAQRVHLLTQVLANRLSRSGIEIDHQHFFDTLTIRVNDRDGIAKRANAAKINPRWFEDDRVGISLDEKTTIDDVVELLAVVTGEVTTVDLEGIDLESSIPDSLQRETPFLTHPVFNSYHSETELLRYLKRLENKDFSLTHGMIPLGSCTMKLNATTEMVPVSWPEFAGLHPFARRNSRSAIAK